MITTENGISAFSPDELYADGWEEKREALLKAAKIETISSDEDVLAAEQLENQLSEHIYRLDTASYAVRTQLKSLYSELSRWTLQQEVQLSEARRRLRNLLAEYSWRHAPVAPPPPPVDDPLAALEKLVQFVDSLDMEFGRVSKQKYRESYDILKAARNTIAKAKETDQ